MTIHSSLRGADALKGERSVLKRIERIQKLSKEGKFDPEQDSVWGLPKVRTKFKVVTAKKAVSVDETKEETVAGEGSEEAADKDAKGKSV